MQDICFSSNLILMLHKLIIHYAQSSSTTTEAGTADGLQEGSPGHQGARSCCNPPSPSRSGLVLGINVPQSSPCTPVDNSNPLLAVYNHTAIAVNRLSADARRVLARQKHYTSRDLTRLRWPSHRACELLLCLVVHSCRDERSPDRSWGNCVDTDAARHVLVAQTPSEGDDGALGTGVVEQVWPADIGVDAGIVDDGGPALHVWEEIFGKIEHGVDVHVEGVVPLLTVRRLHVSSTLCH